jgi:hypothetical protein
MLPFTVTVDPQMAINSCIRAQSPKQEFYLDDDFSQRINSDYSWKYHGIGDGQQIYAKSVYKNITLFISPFGEARFPEATLEISPKNTIQELKEKICEVSGIPPANQRLLYNKTPLQDGTIIQNGLSEYSEVMLFKT